MKIIDIPQASQNNTVLTIGSFDGVHMGHQKILKQVVQAANELNCDAAVLTMAPHPREFFSPKHAPNLLTSEEKKLTLLESMQIDTVFRLRFDKDTANLDREEFASKIIRDCCRATKVYVGHDFCFGKDAQGNFRFLDENGKALGFEAKQVDALHMLGERVSSTLIRERILQGDLDEAATFLGRRYSITGEVISGRGIGHRIGYPTANIKPQHSAIPPQGVYIAEVALSAKDSPEEAVRYPAAVNIGIAPTIRQEDKLVEAFIMGFSGDILGKTIEVFFHKRLRPEKKFASEQKLVEQIAIDVEAAKEHFSEEKDSV